MPAIWALVAGLVLIFLARLTAWANWGANASLDAQWSNANMLVNPAAWPKDDPRLKRWIYVTAWASIVFGLLAALCIPLAAALVTL